ncbi:MAG: spore cortex biosynthesis protein YabQ [Tyzzerella sp.]|nr:spore cortex biosynthesis protein YabQ [Tyzzerella sp.]
MLGIEKEVSVFLQAVLAGNLVYLVYSAIRVFRRIVKHNLFFISVEDFIFWIGAALYLFVKIDQTSSGNIRWYFVLGVLAGALLTHYFIYKIMKKYIDKSKKTR